MQKFLITCCWDARGFINIALFHPRSINASNGRLNGRPIRIPANHSPLSQGEVNFAETMFYDELEPDDENPAPGTPGAPVLEEEGGKGTRDLGNLLERKRQKREPSSSGSRECVVVREPRGRLIYRL